LAFDGALICSRNILFLGERLMNRTATWFVLVVLLLSSAQSGYAQNCEAILGYVRDTSEKTLSLDSRFSFKRFFCDQTFSSYQEATDRGLQAGVFLDGLPLTFGGHDRGSSWSQYQRTICESVAISSSLSLELRDYVVKADAAVVDAWSKCVSKPGLHFWLEANQGTPTVVDLVAVYNGLGRQYEATPQPLKITPLTALNCGSKTISAKGYLNNQESRVSCTRPTTPDDVMPPVNVVLPTTAGDGSVKIPPFIPNPEYKQVIEEQNASCVKDRNQMIADGPKVGDKHVVHVECSAPGPITRWTYLGCEGYPCGWLLRLEPQDANFGNFVSLRFATNSSDYLKVSATIYYNQTKTVCIKHCSPAVLSFKPTQ
jgi:hypothetical protein